MGDVIQSYSVNLLPNEKLCGYVHLLFDLGSHKEGWIKASSSSVVIAGFEILWLGDPTVHGTGLAGIAAARETGIPLYFPHYADDDFLFSPDPNAAWWTLVSLANANPSATGGLRLEAFSDDGSLGDVYSGTLKSQGSFSQFVYDLFFHRPGGG